MKFFLVLALAVAVAVAVPVDDRTAEIIENDNDNIGTGPYNAKYRTSNGISGTQSGVLKNEGTENEATEVRGSYSYTGTDGVVYTVTYIANEYGFQPQGAHLPVPVQP